MSYKPKHIPAASDHKYWGQIYSPSLHKNHTKHMTEQQAAQYSNSRDKGSKEGKICTWPSYKVFPDHENPYEAPQSP